ncbi:MAG: LysE family translocator [Burkholderiaceae bacterium]|nr:LysE family translocator [Burkholderiaceae bacterium]
MTPQTALAVCTFAAVSSITPGPNNLMLLSSGVRHGFRASLPHMLGITFGFIVLMLATGLGLGALFERWPVLHELLRLAGAVYLAALAWQLWRADAPHASSMSGSPSAGEADCRPPMSFLGAALFQWVNPKAWLMAIGAVAGFSGSETSAWTMLALALLCGVVNLPCISVWAYGGARLSHWLSRSRPRQLFNAVMAVLLLGCIYPMVVN